MDRPVAERATGTHPRLARTTMPPRVAAPTRLARARRGARLCAALALAGLPAFPALAGPAGAEGTDFIYLVEPGDTLIGLASRFMTGPDGWRLLQDVNRVPDPYRLVPGARIRIPFSQIPVAPSTARVVFVRGQVRADGAPLAAGASVAESARIETGADGSATLELPDRTRVTLPPSSAVEVRRLRTFARAGLTDTVLNIDRGAADARVAPQGGGVGRYEMRTPLMVTGVRGTRYRVAADAEGSRGEVLEGRVGVSAGRTGGGAGGRADGRADPGTSGGNKGGNEGGNEGGTNGSTNGGTNGGIAGGIDGSAAGRATRSAGGGGGRAATVAAGFGIAVTAAGQVSKPVALLPAPSVAALPRPVPGAGVTAHWQAVPGAAGYAVAVTRDDALTELVWTGRVERAEAALAGLPEGDLFLAVSAIAANRLTGPAGVVPFTVRLNPPAPFTLAPRPDATRYGEGIEFQWAAVPAAAGYELALAVDKDFTQAAEVFRVDGMQVSRRLAPGRWWWRVRSLDASGQPGPWGEALAASVEPAPPVPTPEDDGSRLRIRWAAGTGLGAGTGSGASSAYIFQMAADPGFARLVAGQRTTDNEITLPRPAAGTYYIRVARAGGEADPLPAAAAFSAPQRIDLPQFLRDAQGGMIAFGSEGNGVRLGRIE